MKKHVLIIGANSDIGLSAARLYLDKGCTVTFAAHKPEDLPEWAERRVKVNLEEIEESCAILDAVECDIVLFCAGKLASNEACRDLALAEKVRKVNFDAPAAVLPLFAHKMKQRGSGVLVGISSVAGDRGKASHSLYGACKAGFDSLLAGLRQELHGSGARVLTIRPGYVDSKMISGMRTPGFLTASREQVAAKIVRHSLKGGRNIVYVKALWRPLMWMIRHIPETLFKRMKL